LNDASTATPAAADAPQSFPRAIRIDRPHDYNRLDLQIKKIDPNVDLGPDRFQLSQPANSELVRVDASANSKQPATDANP
jgi:outer membrane lipoprotein-sorting protein